MYVILSCKMHSTSTVPCTQDLEMRLGRYQEKSDRLQVENSELQKQLKQQLEDQEQMITFLKKKSSEQAESFVDLEEKLAAVQQVNLATTRALIIMCETLGLISHFLCMSCSQIYSMVTRTYRHNYLINFIGQQKIINLEIACEMSRTSKQLHAS